jgi:hypothetical protein
MEVLHGKETGKETRSKESFGGPGEKAVHFEKHLGLQDLPEVIHQPLVGSLPAKKSNIGHRACSPPFHGETAFLFF